MSTRSSSRQTAAARANTSTSPSHINPLDNPLRNVRSNIVQSIRAFRIPELQAAAKLLDQRFLHATLGSAQSKQEVLDMIGEQFGLPVHNGKNFDALYDCITDPLHKSGPQAGFIVVLEHIPTNAKFDKDAREQLIDIFRDAADYWSDRKVPFRCFYSFAVARSVTPKRSSRKAASADADSAADKPLTDKLLDVSPKALRMSNPFNPHYWLHDDDSDNATDN